MTDDAILISVFLLDEVILGFYYSNIIQESGGSELASTITLVLRKPNCARKRQHVNKKSDSAVRQGALRKREKKYQTLVI